MSPRRQEWPDTLVGHCCGCGAFDVALYRVYENVCRYRCKTCLEQEEAGRPTQKQA